MIEAGREILEPLIREFDKPLLFVDIPSYLIPARKPNEAIHSYIWNFDNAVEFLRDEVEKNDKILASAFDFKLNRFQGRDYVIGSNYLIVFFNFVSKELNCI